MEIIGLTDENIRRISSLKGEEEQTLNFRLESFKAFQELDLPSFGPEIDIDFSKIIY